MQPLFDMAGAGRSGYALSLAFDQGNAHGRRPTDRDPLPALRQARQGQANWSPAALLQSHCRVLAFEKKERRDAADERMRGMMWELLQNAGVVEEGKPLPPRKSQTE